MLIVAICLVMSPPAFGRSDNPTAVQIAAARVAVLNLVGDDGGEFTRLLREEAKGDTAEIGLIDEEQLDVALRGAGYAGSLNLSLDEARALGLSLGCDYFVIGKVVVARRIASENKFYFESAAGMFLVETRSGRLLRFSFARAEAEREADVRVHLASALRASWKAFVGAIRQGEWREGASNSAEPEQVIDLSEPSAAGITPPIFFQRLKPQYTAEARLVGLAATVELNAVFQADGRVGRVEVVRWAGFGLDEAAIAVVRQLRFKPAESDGRKISVRARVQYNFR